MGNIIDRINHIAENWWIWQTAMLWQLIALVIIVSALDALLRKWAWPQIRYVIWLAILLKLVLTPAFSLNTSMTAKLEPLVMQFIQPESQPDTQSISESPTSVIPSNEPIIPATAPAPINSGPVQEPIQPQVKTNSVKPVITTQLNWQSWTMAGWLAGIIGLGFWLLIRVHRLQTGMARQEPDVLPDNFRQTVAACAAQLGLRRPVKIILSDSVVCPAVFGIFRPVLVMPASSLKDLSDSDLRHHLLHELAHIKRGDLLIHAGYMLVQLCYWFNPLVWMVGRQLQHLREVCCDATVARVLKDKTPQYRETLLETARRLLAQPVEPGMGLLGLFEDSNRLLVRLQWLEKKTWKWRPLQVASALIAALVMFACVLPMAQAKKQVILETEQLTIYDVNRNVSQFKQENLKTPQAAYAVINAVCASGKAESLKRVSIPKLADSMPQIDQTIDPSWAQTLQNARILRVYIIDSHQALVAARLLPENSSQPIERPIDVRRLEMIDGRWLNAGQERVDSLDQVAEMAQVLITQLKPSEHDNALALKTGQLAFRAAVHSNELTDEEINHLNDQFKPYSGDGRMGWFEVAEKTLNAPNLIIHESNGKLYALLWATPNKSMIPEQGWSLTNVNVTQDQRSMPAILIEMNEKGAQLLGDLSGSNIGRAMAILIDDKVVSTPIVQARIGQRAMITGRFSRDDIEKMALSLIKGMVFEEKPDIARSGDLSGLAFLLVVDPAKDHIASEAIERFKADFDAYRDYHQPPMGWFEVSDKVTIGSEAVTIDNEEKRYVLLFTSGKGVMRKEQGWHLTYARVDARTQPPCIRCGLDAVGKQLFSELTAGHIRRNLAAVIDGKVVTAPMIMTRIEDAISISGNFTAAEAQGIADSLQSQVSVPLSDRTVESIMRGEISAGQRVSEKAVAAQKTAKALIDAIKSKDLNAISQYIRPDQIGDMSLGKLFDVAFVDNITLGKVIADDENAITVTQGLREKDGREWQLGLSFRYDGQQWLLRDIDWLPPDKIESWIERFEKDHPFVGEIPGNYPVGMNQADDQDIEAINSLLKQWYDLCQKNEESGLNAFYPNDYSQVSRDLNDFRKLFGQPENKHWGFGIHTILHTPAHAQAFSVEIPKGDPKDGGPVMMVWTLEKRLNGWKIVDIDLETPQGILDEIHRFNRQQPNGLTWINELDNPEPPTIPVSVTRPDLKNAADLIEPLKVLFGAVYEQMEAKDYEMAKMTMQSFMPTVEQLSQKIKGSLIEQPIEAAIGMVRQMDTALKQGDYDKAHRIIKMFDQTGPGFEMMIKDAAKKAAAADATRPMESGPVQLPQREAVLAALKNTIKAWYHNCMQSNTEELARWCVPGYDDIESNIKEMNMAAKLFVLTGLPGFDKLYWNDEAAFVLSKPFEVTEPGAESPFAMCWTLKPGNDRWLVENTSMFSVANQGKYISAFMSQYPDREFYYDPMTSKPQNPAGSTYSNVAELVGILEIVGELSQAAYEWLERGDMETALMLVGQIQKRVPAALAAVKGTPIETMAQNLAEQMDDVSGLINAGKKEQALALIKAMQSAGTQLRQVIEQRTGNQNVPPSSGITASEIAGERQICELFMAGRLKGKTIHAALEAGEMELAGELCQQLITLLEDNKPLAENSRYMPLFDTLATQLRLWLGVIEKRDMAKALTISESLFDLVEEIAPQFQARLKELSNGPSSTGTSQPGNATSSATNALSGGYLVKGTEIILYDSKLDKEVSNACRKVIQTIGYSESKEPRTTSYPYMSEGVRSWKNQEGTVESSRSYIQNKDKEGHLYQCEFIHIPGQPTTILLTCEGPEPYKLINAISSELHKAGLRAYTDFKTAEPTSTSKIPDPQQLYQKLFAAFIACGTRSESALNAVKADDWERADQLCEEIQLEIDKILPGIKTTEFGATWSEAAKQFNIWQDIIKTRNKARAIQMGEMMMELGTRLGMDIDRLKKTPGPTSGSSAISKQAQSQLYHVFMACGALCESLQHAVEAEQWETADALCQQVQATIESNHPIAQKTDAAPLWQAVVNQFNLWQAAIEKRDKKSATQLGNALQNMGGQVYEVIDGWNND